MKKSGSDITTANDDKEGSQAALANDFDVVLMDIQMPKMDGHEATGHLRESGFTEFLTKPIQLQILDELLSRYV